MKNKKTILWISVAFLAVLAILLVCLLFHTAERMGTISEAETHTVRVGGDSNAYYLSAKEHGVAGNHEQIVLSKTQGGTPNHQVDYIFYAPEIFYKEGNGTVYIYAPQSSISEPVEKSPAVVVEELSTADEIADYNRHYSSYGLRRLSVRQ